MASPLLDKFREQNPELSGTSDEALADFLHKTYYSDIPFSKFAQTVGVADPNEAGPVRSYGLIPILKGVGDIGGAVGYGLEATGIAPEFGKEVQQSAQDTEQRLTERQSLQAQEDAKQRLFNPDGSLGDFNFGTFAQQAGRSLPGMFVMGVPGGILAKGATTAAKALGAGAAADTIGSGLGFGAAEGVFSGATNAAQEQQTIRNTPFDKLVDNPAFIETYHNETDPTLDQNTRLEQARDIMARKAGDEVFGKTTLSTGAIGALTGGGLFGQLRQGTSGGILARAAKGFAKEASQEAPQSAGEQYIQNVAEQKYLDPNTDPYRDVLTSAVEGGLVGGALGLGGVFSPSREQQEVDQKISELAKAPSVDEAIVKANELMTLPAPALKMGFDRSAAMPRDQITFSDGSTISAHEYFNARKAEHGDEARARQETYQALNGAPDSVPLGLPNLIFDANDKGYDRKALTQALLDNGASEQQVQDYLARLAAPAEEAQKETDLSAYRALQDRNFRERQSLPHGPTTVRQLMPEELPIGLPNLVFDAEGKSYDRTALLRELQAAGVPEQQAQAYVAKIGTPGASAPKETDLSAYRNLQDRNFRERQSLPHGPTTVRQLMPENRPIGLPELGVTPEGKSFNKRELVAEYVAAGVPVQDAWRYVNAIGKSEAAKPGAPDPLKEYYDLQAKTNQAPALPGEFTGVRRPTESTGRDAELDPDTATASGDIAGSAPGNQPTTTGEQVPAAGLAPAHQTPRAYEFRGYSNGVEPTVVPENIAAAPGLAPDAVSGKLKIGDVVQAKPGTDAIGGTITAIREYGKKQFIETDQSGGRRFEASKFVAEKQQAVAPEAQSTEVNRQKLAEVRQQIQAYESFLACLRR